MPLKTQDLQTRFKICSPEFGAGNFHDSLFVDSLLSFREPGNVLRLSYKKINLKQSAIAVLNIKDAIEGFCLAWLLHFMQFGEENLSPESLAGPSLRLVNGSNRKSK